MPHSFGQKQSRRNDLRPCSRALAHLSASGDDRHFQEEPFNLKPEELQDLMQSFPKDPKKSDIKFTTSSLGTVFLYSNKYLEDDYADFLAQYLDVDQVMSP